MTAVTLTTLRARARSRADMPVAGYIADDANGIDAWINEGVQKIQEMLVKAYGEAYRETTSTFNTVAGTSDYALPTDLLAFYGAESTIGGIKFTLLPYSNAERNIRANQLVNYSGQCPRYRLVGMSAGVIRLLPTPVAVYPVTLQYAPSATLLVNGSDSVNFPNGWERYAVVYTAIQMLMKEESDVRELRTELNKMELELTEIAQRRNADQPHSTVDIESVEEANPLNYI